MVKCRIFLGKAESSNYAVSHRHFGPIHDERRVKVCFSDVFVYEKLSNRLALTQGKTTASLKYLLNAGHFGEKPRSYFHAPAGAKREGDHVISFPVNQSNPLRNRSFFVRVGWLCLMNQYRRRTKMI